MSLYDDLEKAWRRDTFWYRVRIGFVGLVLLVLALAAGNTLIGPDPECGKVTYANHQN